MSNQVVKQKLASMPIKDLVERPRIKDRIQKTLKGRSSEFVSSLLSVVNSNQSLKRVDHTSIVSAAMQGALLNLPINKNLGYMWLVPYGGKAQAQIGYKGYIQLAQRTGQYKAMNAIAVHEGELISWNPLTEDIEYDPSKKKSDKVIGYIGYFKLINGFRKAEYWTKEQIEQHRQQFNSSKNKKKLTGVWYNNYDAMAIKTVLKNLLTKWGPMNIEMAKAASIDDENTNNDEFDDEENGSSTRNDSDEMKDIVKKSNSKRKNINASEADEPKSSATSDNSSVAHSASNSGSKEADSSGKSEDDYPF